MYAIVDIETTGGYAAANGITEIAVYIHDGVSVQKHFETLVNPGQSIPPYITALTGINNAMVVTAPSFEEIAETLYELLQPCVFVAHNVNFDYSFVKHQLKLAGYDLTAAKLCTVRLGRKIFPGLPSYSLGNLCRSLNISIQDRHRAGGDAKATVKLFEHYLANEGMEVIDSMLKRHSKEHWLPLHLDKKEIDQLPPSPGVYYFHNAKGKIVYVGKAIHLKKRVSSHFTQNDPDKKRQNLLRTIHRISFQQCATELEAIVLESTEIKRLWPQYNKHQKQPVQKFGLYQFEDSKGFIRLAIDKKKKTLPALCYFNLLQEGITMLNKMIAEFELHPKLCHVDTNRITTKDWDLIGAPIAYNAKLQQALAAFEASLPTFALVDEGIEAEEQLCLLVERGSFWGMGYLPKSFPLKQAAELKNYLNPYADNDYIRNCIYSFAAQYPAKKVLLQL